jgi:hypothetical protein
MSPRTAGYSGTPLAKKLGIDKGSCVLAVEPPEDYRTLLAPIPIGTTFASRISTKVDLVHLFVIQSARLAGRLAVLRTAIRPDAVIWVSWPKKASKVSTDITENTIRSVALPLGLVDVKVCAVSEVWSGLKLVVRKAERRL